MSKLTGKIAVVTGASKGIGAAIAKQLAADGALVVVNYASSREGADKTVHEITKAGGKAIAVQGDASKKADVVRLFAETEKAFGPADILVNNAGVYAFAPLAEITEEHFYKHFGLNVLGLLFASQEAVKHFGERGGSIINIGSIVDTLAMPGASVYSGTKGAVRTITNTLAAELGPKKIRVNNVAPGLVATEGTAEMLGGDNKMEKAMIARTPLGRTGKPDDIATVVSFLASEDAKWITGTTLYAGGGVA